MAGPLPAEPPSGPSPARIANLVRQLGHDKYAEREAAAKALSAIGDCRRPFFSRGSRTTIGGLGEWAASR